MAFSDARNERDRAETGRNSTNHGGGDARAAADRNRNAMAANNSPMNRGFNPNFNPRRTPNMSPSYEMSLRNMMALSGMMPGPGMAVRAGMMASGLGPQFEGYTGNVMGPGDYDPKNWLGQRGGSAMGMPAGRPPITAAGQPKPVTPPGMTPLQVPAAQLSVPGPSQYGVNLPSYGYFGQPPALQRPGMSAILNPMQPPGNPIRSLRPGPRVMPYR